MQLNRKTRRSLRAKNKRNRKATKARVFQYVETKDGRTKNIHHFRSDSSLAVDLPQLYDQPSSHIVPKV